MLFLHYNKPNKCTQTRQSLSSDTMYLWCKKPFLLYGMNDIFVAKSGRNSREFMECIMSVHQKCMWTTMFQMVLFLLFPGLFWVFWKMASLINNISSSACGDWKPTIWFANSRTNVHLKRLKVCCCTVRSMTKICCWLSTAYYSKKSVSSSWLKQDSFSIEFHLRHCKCHPVSAKQIGMCCCCSHLHLVQLRKTSESQNDLITFEFMSF